jgi:hypothetical protein
MRASWRRWTRGWSTAALAGGFFLCSATALFEETFGLPQMAVSFVTGAAFALAVLALLRLFQPGGWAHLVAGLLVGPVPFLAVIGPSTPLAERGGLYVLGALLGLALGALEWDRSRRERAAP